MLAAGFCVASGRTASGARLVFTKTHNGKARAAEAKVPVPESWYSRLSTRNVAQTHAGEHARMLTPPFAEWKAVMLRITFAGLLAVGALAAGAATSGAASGDRMAFPLGKQAFVGSSSAGKKAEATLSRDTTRVSVGVMVRRRCRGDWKSHNGWVSIGGRLNGGVLRYHHRATNAGRTIETWGRATVRGSVITGWVRQRDWTTGARRYQWSCKADKVRLTVHRWNPAMYKGMADGGNGSAEMYVEMFGRGIRDLDGGTPAAGSARVKDFVAEATGGCPVRLELPRDPWLLAQVYDGEASIKREWFNDGQRVRGRADYAEIYLVMRRPGVYTGTILLKDYFTPHGEGCTATLQLTLRAF
jgi:hypothetical protein